MKKLNLFTTKSGTMFVSLDKELKSESNVKTWFGNTFGVVKALGTFIWTAKSLAECEYLGSYANLEAACEAVKSYKAELEAAFN
jgi:hypothetical protein